MPPMRRTHRMRRTHLMQAGTAINQRTVTIELAVYSLETIKRSAYRFTDRFSLSLRIDGDNAACELTFADSTSVESADRIVSDFQKELLDQDLRAIVRDETKDVRNLILAHAFSRTGLIGDVTIPTA